VGRLILSRPAGYRWRERHPTISSEEVYAREDSLREYTHCQFEPGHALELLSRGKSPQTQTLVPRQVRRQHPKTFQLELSSS
jgi:hypothetical protein